METLPNKNQLLHIEDSNSRCFILCIAAFFLRDKLIDPSNGNDPKYQKFIKEFMDLSNINFPCEYNDIQVFVERNQNLNIQVNILTLYGKNVFPTATFGSGKHVVNLLAVCSKPKSKRGEQRLKDQKYVKGHFLLIKVI